MEWLVQVLVQVRKKNKKKFNLDKKNLDPKKLGSYIYIEVYLRKGQRGSTQKIT